MVRRTDDLLREVIALRAAVQALAPDPPPSFAARFERVLDAAIAVFGYTRAALLSRRRQDGLVFARHCAMTVMAEIPGASVSEVARFWQRHHGAILHARKEIRERSYSQGDWRRSVNNFLAQIRDLAGLDHDADQR